MTTIKKYESKTQPGLFFWVEANGGGAGAVESYCVVSQMTGFPATEAHDDWFCRFADADAMAKLLAVCAPEPEELSILEKSYQANHVSPMHDGHDYFEHNGCLWAVPQNTKGPVCMDEALKVAEFEDQLTEEQANTVRLVLKLNGEKSADDETKLTSEELQVTVGDLLSALRQVYEELGKYPRFSVSDLRMKIVKGAINRAMGVK